MITATRQPNSFTQICTGKRGPASEELTRLRLRLDLRAENGPDRSCPTNQLGHPAGGHRRARPARAPSLHRTPSHLEERPHPLPGHADQQADLQQARGQHVLHGTAGQGQPGQRAAATPSRRAARPLPAGRTGLGRVAGGGRAPAPSHRQARTQQPSPPLTVTHALIGCLSRRSEDL